MNNINGSFIPVIVYNNTDIGILQILKDNANKAGITCGLKKNLVKCT